MTAKELAARERRLGRAWVTYEAAREARNAGVREALAEGWTHAQIAEATGLTRGRIGQLATSRTEDR